MAKEFKTTLTIAGKVDRSLNNALKAAEKASKSSASQIADNVKKTSETSEKAAKNTGSKIADHIKNAANTAGNAVKIAGSKIVNGMKSIAQTTGKVMVAGATAATLAVGAMGVAAVNNAAEMQTQMQNVATLLDGSAVKVKARTNELAEDVIKVSNSTGIVTEDLTSGLYDVISAVGDTKDSIKILEISAKSAAAGNAKTSEAVSLLTAVTKGYGDTSAEAFGKVSDLAFQTVKLGQTTFPELAASIGKVTPLASALGVKQEELFGVFATLTGVTGSAAEVSTQYKAVLSGLMSPSKNMIDALNQMGFESGAAAIETLGFQGTLEKLMETQNNDTMATSKLFSSVEAQTSILALCGAQAENLTEKTEAMFKSQGAADAAFATQTQNLQYSIQRLKNLGQNFLTSMGMKLLPFIADLAEKALPKVQSALEAIGPPIADLIQKAGPKIVDLTSKLMPVITTVISNLPKIIDFIGKFGSSLTAKLKPVAEVALNLLKGIGEKIAPMIENMFSGMGDGGILDPLIDSIVTALPILVDFATKIYETFEPMGQAVIEIFTEIAPVIVGAIQQIEGVFSGINGPEVFLVGIGTLIESIILTIKKIVPVVSNIISTTAPLIASIIGWIGQIAPIISDIVGLVIECAGEIVAVIGPIVSQIIQSLTPAISSIMDIVTSLMPIIRSIILAVTEIISNLQILQPAINTVIQIIGFLADIIARVVKSMIDAWTPAIQSIIGYAKNIILVFEGVASFFSNIFLGNWQEVWNSAVNIVGNIGEAIKSALISAVQLAVAPINMLIKGANKALSALKLPLIPEIEVTGFANGGTVTSPTFAMIGEGGDNETIIPHRNTPRSRELLATAAKGVYGKDIPTNQSKNVQYTYAPVINATNSNGVKEVLREDFERFKAWVEQKESEDNREVFV